MHVRHLALTDALRWAMRYRFRIVLLLGLSLSLPSAASLQALADAAAQQIGVTTGYDGRYVELDYPGGDVPLNTGVCTDVLIRAYRVLGIDLQQRVHEDMRRHFAAYPPLWGLRAPDRNIDHRRVPNLETYFRRHGESLRPSRDDADFRTGDIVSWRLPRGLPHIGIVSPRRHGARPMIIHNIGNGVQEEDVLRAWPIHGHYRYRP